MVELGGHESYVRGFVCVPNHKATLGYQIAYEALEHADCWNIVITHKILSKRALVCGHAIWTAKFVPRETLIRAR